MASRLLVNDLVEKEIGTAPKPLQDDDFQSPATGFPAPKKRTRVSAFKQRKAAAAGTVANAATAAAHSTPREGQGGGQASEKDFYETEKRRIDRENRERIQAMSPQEVEEAQRELLGGLDVSLLERLLKRSNIDDQDDIKFPFDAPPESRPPESRPPPPAVTVEDEAEDEDEDVTSAVLPPKKAAEAAPEKPAPKKPSPPPVDEDRAPDNLPKDLFPISDAPVSTHFPAARDPDLDPSDPGFLESLHKKYFPNLAADPSKLAWMAPLPTEGSQADRDSPYFPEQASLPASALRFDFTGRLLPPRLSRTIPSSKGLHHHGQAPEAAGYTVEELCILARSAVAAQRCIAYQTLGRVLFRLGNGEWGTSIEDPLAMGIWAGVKKGRALDSLGDAAAQEHGHRSSQAFAMEALWLFEKGGWKEKTRGR